MVNATVLKTVGSCGLYGFESCLLRQSSCAGWRLSQAFATLVRRPGFLIGLVAQWLERDPYKVLVAGSIPAEPTTLKEPGDDVYEQEQ